MPESNFSPDPYAAAVDQIGDAWTFLVTREAFFGAKRFEDFCAQLSVSRPRLSDRLTHLVDAEIFKKVQYSYKPPRFEYHFTDKGLAVYQIALSLIDWGNTWRFVPGAPTLKHKPCGNSLELVLTCRCCTNPVSHSTIQWPKILPIDSLSTGDKPLGPTVRRWRKTEMLNVSERIDPAVKTLRAIGDRWSMLIMYGAQQRQFRFREAQSKLGLAHNILSNRLGTLVDQGLLERADETRQAAYQPTPSGLALLAPTLVTRTWAIDWIKPKHGTWSSVIHEPCGQDLLVDYTCASCGKLVEPTDVTY